MASKRCSKCNIEFTCCNETRGCWCESYTLTEKTLEALKAEFENCLCEKCLALYAESFGLPH
jgi:hypothetical protein